MQFQCFSPDSSRFIEFITDEIKKTGGINREMIENNAVMAMGLSTFSFPSDSEIDLIERVSGDFKDKSKLLKFKKNMMSYLKDREIGKIRKGG